MSSLPHHYAVRFGLLLALAGIGAVGCGATGLDWVAEPETPPRAAEHEYLATPRPPEPSPVLATTEEEPAPEAHPRLSRTVTLGEINVAPVAEGAAPGAGSGVSVTINNYSSPGAGYGYAGYGYAGGYARSSGFGARSTVSGASRSSGSGPQIGQNWPSVADHGSSFPSRSAPASPWARTQ